MTQPTDTVSSRPESAIDLRNLLLLHLWPGAGDRRVAELLTRAPFLLREPADRNFWLYAGKHLRLPLGPRKCDTLERRADRILEQQGRGEFALLHRFDPAYPPLLAAIYDPPLVLYRRGRPELLAADCLAVVGARQASDYGVGVAGELSARLAEAGLTIVGGMARGIDAAAHLGALRAGGRSLAVLGCGVDIIYPREAGKLYHRLLEQGCVVSEFPPGSWPAPANFPIRNRVISGLSLGVLVVEATPRSGSLITARLALEQGRELFAVPGPVHAPLSVGPNYLVKQGAKLVQVWTDVLEDLPPHVRERLNWPPLASGAGTPAPVAPPPAPADLTSAETSVYKLLLRDRKIHLEELLQQTGLGVGELGRVVLNLQFRGLIQELPGQYYVRA